jgi:hypothetical protein
MGESVMKRYRVDYMRAEGNRGRTGTFDARDPHDALRKAKEGICLVEEYIYQIYDVGADCPVYDYFNGMLDWSGIED